MRRRLALIGVVLLLPLAGCASFGKSSPLEYRQRLQAQREHDRALAMAEPAEESAPDTVEGRIARGDRYAETGDGARAFWQYLEAHKLDPEHPAPLVRLGYEALEDDAERAATLFARAVEADPERADAHAGLGLARLSQQRLPEARAALERAVELDPQSWAAHDALGVVYALEDDGARSRDQGQRAIELSPRDARIVNNLGVALLQLDRTEEAKSKFMQALDWNENYHPALYNMGLLHIRKEELDKAPNTLSLGCTSCDPSGVRLSIFLPSFAKLRPPQDISKWLSAGPTACDARLEFSNSTLIPTTFASCTSKMRASGLCRPAESTPLKRLLARPSQKFRWLNTALITVGVFRGSTRRTLMPLTWNPTGSPPA